VPRFTIVGLARSTAWRLGLVLALAGLAAIGHAAGRSPADHPDSGAGMIGRPAPALAFDRWIGAKPTSLAQLRGKVVLVRWWTEGCHYCETTLPVIERARRAHPQDLVTIGVFHPKPPRAVGDRRILALAKELGYGGAIAVDQEWKALDRWWLDGHPERSWTSVSFLIDRAGRVRWVHGGGEYHPSDDPRHARCDQQHDEFQATLATLLAERAGAPAP
jgi:thiol-disulfide isomerase/thioredoxin